MNVMTIEEAVEALTDDSHYVVKLGWLRSYMERRAVALDGEPVPWYVYAIVKFIEPRLTKDMKIYEFGSGYSTLWYGKRVNSVIAVEEKQPWVDILRGMATPNIEIVFAEGDDYTYHITEYKDSFDVICIDGEDRSRYALNCLPALKDDGVIIWDNSATSGENVGYKHLTDNGFKRLDFYGLTPVCTYENCTSIFYRQNNCLNI